MATHTMPAANISTEALWLLPLRASLPAVPLFPGRMRAARDRASAACHSTLPPLPPFDSWESIQCVSHETLVTERNLFRFMLTNCGPRLSPPGRHFKLFKNYTNAHLDQLPDADNL